MSARVQHAGNVATVFPSNFASNAFSLPVFHNPGTVPNGQTDARVFPVLAASGEGPYTSYPSQDDNDEELLYTYASHNEEPIAALAVNKRHGDTWTIAVPVPIPGIPNPTLLAVDYMIKYATTHDNGNATIQTDTILTAESLPEGVVTDTTELSVYNNETGYAPRTINHDEALRLSTTLAIKCNGGGPNWSHYIDNQHITPRVRVVDEAHLYVVFHVCEYPTVETIRSLAVEVSATWQKQEVELKAKAEAERKAREEAAKIAKAEAERKARWAEERQAREEERQARAEERQARAEERQARAEERQARGEQKAAREEARQERERVRARDAANVADNDMQSRIAQTMKKLNLAPCEQGYAFRRTEFGYQCEGGGHKVTWDQLGMRP